MKNIIRTSLGAISVILGIMTFVFDFLTARNIPDIVSEDPYPLQWASVVAAIFCAGGLVLLLPVTELQEKNPIDDKEILAMENLKNRIKSSYYAKVSSWASFKHGLTTI